MESFLDFTNRLENLSPEEQREEEAKRKALKDARKAEEDRTRWMTSPNYLAYKASREKELEADILDKTDKLKVALSVIDATESVAKDQFMLVKWNEDRQDCLNKGTESETNLKMNVEDLCLRVTQRRDKDLIELDERCESRCLLIQQKAEADIQSLKAAREARSILLQRTAEATLLNLRTTSASQCAAIQQRILPKLDYYDKRIREAEARMDKRKTPAILKLEEEIKALESALAELSV